ncbi:MAG: BASS family bile acid:Na+ symporter [Neolewinella sp.]|jgi:BASS family bile acid:Na+ symporter
MLKSVLILLALGVGLLLPQLGSFTFVLRPFLMTLLFFSFLNIKLDRNVFAWQQLVAAALLPLFGLSVYYLSHWYDENLALTLLLVGLAPTAVITPVLAELMKRSAAYMVGAIIVTSMVFTLVVPVMLTWLLGIELSLASLGTLVYTIGSIVIIPMLLAQVVRKIDGKLAAVFRAINPYVFVLFLINVAVAAGSLSHYLQYESSTPWSFIWLTAGAITLLMLTKFLVGSFIAPKGHTLEGSLALGRKNTMLAIWIALEYLNPLIVLGPMIYILAQNVFVAGQIWWVERKAGAVPD